MQFPHPFQGLLFNYGVTCSGKTYTMTGSPSTPGFLPRALEMIFSSIEGRQTKEFQIQPDDKNGFRFALSFLFRNHFEMIFLILTLNF